MRRRRLLSLIGLVGVLATLPVGVASAQDAPGVQIREVDTSAYPTVALTVAVAGDTDPNAIRVLENGLDTEVFNVRPLLTQGDEVDMVLALDTSRSVAGEPLAAAVEAAEAFVETLPDGVPVGVLTFSNRVRVGVPVSTDHEAALAFLGQLTKTQSGTRLYDGMAGATEMFTGSGQHNIVLFTDGSDTGSTMDLGTAVSEAQAADAAVHTVGLEGATTDFQALEAISTQTGGTFSQAATADLPALFESLAGTLTHQYRVLYRSRGPAGAQVDVRVQAPSGYDEQTVLFPKQPFVEAGHGPFFFLAGAWGLGVVLVLAFLAAFLLVSLVVGAGARARRDRELARRMAAGAIPGTPGVPSRPDGGPASWIPSPLAHAGQAVAEAGGFRTGIDRKLERAGLPLSAGEVVAGSLLAAFVGGVIGWLISRNVVITGAAAIFAGALPFFFLDRAMNKRLNALHGQLPDVLSILASSLRAGHSFLQALDTVAKEVGDPGGPEFGRVVAEIRLGRPFEEAMNALAERVGTEEFKWAILAINVQREVGGNLAEILDVLSETVREREAIRRQVRVLSAEGRLSAKILIAMPFLIALYLTWVNPDYMRLLWTTTLGWIMLGIGGILMVIGAIWSWRMVKIDV
jgi:tight adherence protein B